MTFYENLKNDFGYNEPIYLENIKFQNYSRPWIFKELKKLVDNGDLKRFGSGIYYFPKKMPWGDSALDTKKILEYRFLSDGDNIYGYIAGNTLLNKIGLSTQVPNLFELVSNNESTRVRDIYIGNQRIRARRSRTKVTKQNVKALQFLDLMNTISPSSLDDTERYMLNKYVKGSDITRNEISRYIKFFPARAMKNMIESGVVFELTHG